MLALAADDIVVTTSGSIKGIVGSNYRSFMGIPYAEPPVGLLRWANTVPAKPWTGIKNTSAFGAACPQRCALPPLCCPIVWSEDCLFLNVFTPRTNGLKPVVLFIHGGSFDQGEGGSPLYNGANYVAMSNTVLVTFNYRLGALGFLTTDTGLKGNYAFFDQLTAMKWVRDNIAAFGGDPKQVTLVGESAGATSVGAHLVSPLSAGLFVRAIMQSNPFSIPMSDKEDAEDRSHTFARLITCEDPATQIQCLRKKTPQEIITAQKAMIHLRLEKMIQLFLPWTPIVDGDVIPMHVLDAFVSGKWAKVPLIIGNDGSDATMFVYGAKNASALTLPEYLLVLGLLFQSDSAKVEAQYPGNLFMDHRDLMSQLGTDYIFTCSARYIVQQVAPLGIPVYTYMFNHSMSWDGWGPEFAYCNGKPCHAVELPFQFTSPDVHAIANWTQAEFTISQSLIAAWTNFAYTGNPNKGPMTAKQPLMWPIWAKDQQRSLVFQTPNIIRNDLMGQKCDFWDSLSKKYHFGW